MQVNDKNGNEIEISVSGRYEDDIQIEEAYYVDETLGEVSDETINYIQDNYAEDIYESWFDKQLGMSESIWEGDR
jgi:hypothetical protein